MQQMTVLALAALTLASAPALGADNAVCTKHAADADAAAFFNRLKADEVLSGLRNSLGKAPMMQGRQSDLETLTRQIKTATDIYGPVRNQECVRESALGSMVLRREYLAQHDKMLTRWTMIFQRLPSGWHTVQISYEDQISNWLD